MSLEDLVMDVRPEGRPALPPRAAKPPSTKELPLKRAARASRYRATKTAVALSLLAIAVVGAALARLVVFSGPDTSDRNSLAGRASDESTKNETDDVQEVSQPPFEEKYQTIFDGSSGKGWMLCNNNPVSSRNIQSDGLNPHRCGTYLVVYEEKLDDFELDFNYKLTKGCNTGVFLRVSDLTNPIHTSIEVAIDDTTGSGIHDPGAFYDLVAPTMNAQKPAGQWNHMTIKAIGPKISVVLNAKEVSTIDLDQWNEPGKRPDGSSHKFDNVAIGKLARAGYIGFQDHGEDCWFNQIQMRRLSATSAPSRTIAAAGATPSVTAGAAAPEVDVETVRSKAPIWSRRERARMPSSNTARRWPCGPKMPGS